MSTFFNFMCLKITLILTCFLFSLNNAEINRTLSTPQQISASKLVDSLLDQCPHVGPNSYSPACPLVRNVHLGKHPDLCSTTNISIGLWLERFHEINDVEETFSVSASVHFYWNVTCPGGNFTLPYGDDDILVNVEPGRFWQPKIYHQNAVTDYGMAIAFVDRFTIEKVIDPANPKTAVFYLQHSGVFESTSDMDFGMFPFDHEQHLYMYFLVREKSFTAKFTAFDVIAVADDFMPEGAAWSFIGLNYTITTREILASKRSIAIFSLTFKRKPEYVIYNLMLPAVLLATMQLSSFAMPSEYPDRGIFTISIMLAMTIHQGSVLARIPAKPQHIFLTSYCDLLVYLGWYCTVFALIASAIVESPGSRRWLQMHSKTAPILIRRVRLVDCLGFAIGVVWFIGINIYAVKTAKDAHYF